MVSIFKWLEAGDSYFVMIDKYFNGDITKTATYGWHVLLHPHTILHGDDVRIIIALIEEDLMNGEVELIQ